MGITDDAGCTSAHGADRHTETITQPSLRVEVIRDFSRLVALAPQWQRLVADSHDASVFSPPEAVLTWYQYVGRHSAIHAVAIWSADRLVGMAPFSVVGLGPYQLLSTAGAGFGYHGDPLLGAEPEPVAHAILEHVRGLVSKGTAAVYLRRLLVDGQMLGSVRQHPDLTCVRMGSDETNSVVRFDAMPDPDRYFKKTASKHAIARRHRRLAERFDQVRYVADDPYPDAALDAMRDMLRRRFEDDLRIFRTTQNRNLIFALARDLIPADHARVASLNVGGRRATVSFTLRINSKAHWYAVAYDPELAWYGVGNVELYEYLRDAYESGITEVDLGDSRFSYKQRWANSTSVRRTVAITSPGLPGRVANNLRRLAIHVHRARRLDDSAGPYVV